MTHCLITHSQTFGIRALQHIDHLDPAGERFLRNRHIPVVCQRKDAAYLAKYGLNVHLALDCGSTSPAVAAINGLAYSWPANGCTESRQSLCGVAAFFSEIGQNVIAAQPIGRFAFPCIGVAA